MFQRKNLIENKWKIFGEDVPENKKSPSDPQGFSS